MLFFYFLTKRNSVIRDNTNAIPNTMRYPINSIAVPVTKKPMSSMIAKTHIPPMMICLLSMGDSPFYEDRPVFKFLLFSFVPLWYWSHIANNSTVDFTVIWDKVFTVVAHPSFFIFVGFYERCFLAAFIAFYYRIVHTLPHPNKIFNSFLQWYSKNYPRHIVFWRREEN